MTITDRTSLARGVAAVVFTGIAVATVVIVHREPGLALTGGSATALAAELAASAIAVGAALAIWRPRSTFPGLLVAAASAWLIAEWDSPGAGVAFTPGLVLYAAWPALLAATALRGLDERRLDRPAAAILAVAVVSTVGLLGLGSALVFDPAAQACVQCPANLLGLADSPGLGRAFGHAGLALSVAWITAFAGLAAVRLARSSPARRGLAGPVLVPALAAIVLFGIDAVHGFDRAFVSNDQTDRALRLAEAAALAFIAVGIGGARLRTWRTRRTLAQLVLDVGTAPAPGGLRARLAESLGDPSLELLYRLEGGEWVDADGRTAAVGAAPAREATRVRSGGEEVLAVLHRPGLLDDGELVRELATTASLALQHERLHASRRARLEELRASCARIVAASDATRQALERDLHDGAQQRVVALALSIRLARHQIAADDPSLDAALAAAEAEVRSAVVDLREVAHGLFPAVLAEEGLRPALEALAEHAPRLTPRALPGDRFPGAIESAGYFAALQALRLTKGTVTVDGAAENGTLRLLIGSEGGLERAVKEIRDRVGAVGGTVRAQNGELRLEMPCES